MRPLSTTPLRLGNPVHYRPALRRSSGLAQTSPDMKAAKTQVAGISVIALALSAGAAWLGIRTGLKERGFLSATGWAVATGSVLTGLTSMGLLAALPFVPASAATAPVATP